MTVPGACRTPLEATGLGKTYSRGVTALTSLDVSIEAGTITALVGPNGAGKSTLIKAWVGLEQPTSGHVLVCGIDPRKDAGSTLARTGYVPQTPALYRELSVADHVDLACSLRARFDRPLALKYLRDLEIPLAARGRELSGGQQAQVGLALALGTRADVLLLDEPLASLDPLARREFLSLLVSSVRATGATAVLSSHVVTDVEQACDMLLVLSGGRILLHQDTKMAIAAHTVSAGGVEDLEPSPDLVGTYRGNADEYVSLWRGSAGGSTVVNGRAATLEDVVLGYLASGKNAEAVNNGRRIA